VRGRLRFFAGSILVLAVVSVAGTASVASASTTTNRQHEGPFPMAGVTTCPVDLRMKFSTPLNVTPTTATVSDTFAVNMLEACSNRIQGNVRLIRGHLSDLTGTLPTGTTCIAFLSGFTAPALAGGSVKWTPSSKIATSTGLMFPTGSLSSSQTTLGLSYSSGSLSGSYATTSAAVRATSNADLATLTNLCNSNLFYIGFTGSITL
jgi:hypothetical protein